MKLIAPNLPMDDIAILSLVVVITLTLDPKHMRPWFWHIAIRNNEALC